MAQREDFDKFREYGTLDGGSPGSSEMTITLVQISDDGEIINQTQRTGVEENKPKGGPKSREAGILCRDDNFILWLGAEYPAAFAEGMDAAGLVRRACNIKSRAELDHNPDAYKQFCELRHRYEGASQ